MIDLLIRFHVMKFPNLKGYPSVMINLKCLIEICLKRMFERRLLASIILEKELVLCLSFSKKRFQKAKSTSKLLLKKHEMYCKLQNFILNYILFSYDLPFFINFVRMSSKNFLPDNIFHV